MQGDFFVTPHAVRQFQRRIARLEYEEARQVIIDALSVVALDDYQATRNGKALCIRVREPLAFRALIVEGEGEQPAVATILRSGNTGANRRKLEAHHAAAAH